MRAAGLVDASGLIGSAEQTGTERWSPRAAPTPTACTATSWSRKATSAPSSSAKSALYAGARLLMDEFGTDTVDRIVLAGAFGAHISPKHAMILGMIPDCDLARVTSAGNAAGTGARIALLNVAARREVEELVTRIHKVETAIEPRFQEHFVAANAIPHATAAFPHLGPLPAGQLQRRSLPPAAPGVAQRRPGGTSRSRADRAAMLARSWLRPTRFVDAGRFASDSPGRHSPAGRIGRGTNPPPQFGQTL